MAATATLSSKHQISVPKIIRDEPHWETGQEFVFIPKGKGAADAGNRALDCSLAIISMVAPFCSGSCDPAFKVFGTDALW